MLHKRDVLILKHIIKYCVELAQLKERFGESFAAFSSDQAYQLAASMCLLQIGELAKNLSADATTELSDVSWKQIRGMRNRFAHDDGNVDLQVVWNTISNDIPELHTICSRYIDDSYAYKALNRTELDKLSKSGVEFASKKRDDDTFIIKYHKSDTALIEELLAPLRKNKLS